MEMANRLKKARELAGFEEAADAARALKVAYPTYASHENGSRGFRRDSAFKYARRFKVDVEWLLYGVGNPRGPSIMDKIGALDLDVRQEVEDFIDFKLTERRRQNSQQD